MSDGEEFDKAIAEKNYGKAMNEMNKLWIDTMVYLTKLSRPDLKELNYINVTIETPDGEYILALMHTRGKKIQF